MKYARLFLFVSGILLLSVALWALNGAKEAKDGKHQQYVFTGTENHSIPLDEAADMTRRYRENADLNARLGGLFAREAFDRILSQEGCMGIRFYFAESKDGEMELILVGVDANGNDMEYGELAERIIGCPPFCGSENVLNSESEQITVNTTIGD